jgi:hypothetical protein
MLPLFTWLLTARLRPARVLHVPGAGREQEDPVSRQEKDFLVGFEKAALLAQQILHSPPAYTTAREYLESVVHLHRDSDDLVCRGLVVGCLCAVGK